VRALSYSKPPTPPPLRRTREGRPDTVGAAGETTGVAAVSTSGCPKTSERNTCSSCAGSDATAADADETERAGLRPNSRDRKSSSRSRMTPIPVSCWSDTDPSFLHRIPSCVDNASGVASYWCKPVAIKPGALPADG
jgi:hypothetical protein